MNRTEWKAAWLLVWSVISIVALGLLLAPWLVSAEQLAAVVPRCEWKVKYGKECAFCGMTTAFYDISSGRLAAAVRDNGGSLPLYASLLLNEVAFLGYRWKRTA
ncbi:MAG: DUF2752 domain-containing protein [Acidobacteriaceae bacterium]|nr:DUF2752 domain-containing protein [Acidobacteriaceae bacterium]